MKARDLRLEELVDFSSGSLSLHGRRLVLHDIHAFSQLRKDLTEMAGPEQARRILTRFGYYWGEADAAAMRRILQWDDLSELLRCAGQLQSLQGVTRAVVRSLQLEEGEKPFRMEMVWYESGEAEEHLAQFGQTPEPACWILCGYASGFVSFCLNKRIYFIEKKCLACGDALCLAVGMDAPAWGERLGPSLPFFEADDIRSKILALTEQLKRQESLLARQRRQLGLSNKALLSNLVEVRSEAFRRVLELAGKVAPFDTSVLITGESGTGKEVLARYIHRLSHRSQKPLLAVNCAALPETLLESELFGHTAGAFTGAISERAGLFEHAGGGTLFLDEIGDISLNMQAKLLRVLQEREITPLGQSQPRKVDVRILAATNRNLREAIARGDFREDLFYRLGVIGIEVPPLRQRPEDILPLARMFVGRFAKKLSIPELRLDAASLDYLQAYNWPGNVRELENVIERAAVLSRNGLILPEYLPAALVQTPRPSGRLAGQASLAQLEQEHIHNVLQQTGGNRRKAAKILGISTATLWRKLKAQGHDPAGNGQ